jgi:F-type H+-transporting ATPase subunit delta
LIDEERGIYPAELASGHPLTADDRARLEGVLQRYTGCRLKIDWSVEPSLIGGIVFRFRDLLVDGSLRSGLAEIRRRWRQTSMVRGAA